jgi:hypothetical protein
MRAWPLRPVIYEITTWVWIEELSRRTGRSLPSGTVPPEE